MMRKFIVKYYDKLLHFAVSMMLVCTLSYILPIELACLITLFIGILKEVYDNSIPKNIFDVNDILADCAGIIIGFIYVLMLQ